MYFSLKADYYSKPGEKSFSSLQEMNKVSDEVDEKRIIVTAGCCCYLTRFKSCCCVETRSTLCLGSEFMWVKGWDLSLSLTHISQDIHRKKLHSESKSCNLMTRSVLEGKLLDHMPQTYFFCSVHKCITLGWILQQSMLGCKGILLQKIKMLSNLI